MQSHGATLLAKMLSVLSYEMFTVLCNLGGYCTDHFQCPNLLSIEFCHLVFPVSIYQKNPKKPQKSNNWPNQTKKIETILYANFRQYRICKQVFLSCLISITLSTSIWKALFHFILSLFLYLLLFFGYQYLSCH